MDIHSKEITTLPHTSGVYLYKDTYGVILYVGKAIDIQKRVRQYFEKSAQLSPKTKQLVHAIHSIDHITTISEFDALLLEARLISTYQPKYNMIAKDDKSPIYIHIPIHDPLPIISLVRKPHKGSFPSSSTLIGPFQSTRVAKQILSTLRTIIPYCRQKIRKGKPCFYTHLGLCHPCPSEIVTLDASRKDEYSHRYRKNIFLLKNVLQGKSIATRVYLERRMHQYAKEAHFEQAAHIRNQIHELDTLLQTHFDSSFYQTTPQDMGETLENELNDVKHMLSPYYPHIQTLHRIECVDISQTSGSQQAGSLVVLDEGKINTSLYRRFSIGHIDGQHDTKMIQQVILRRFKHPEWEFPNLLIVDGGKGQVQAAREALAHLSLDIPVIGIAKRLEHIILPQREVLKELHIPLTRPCIHLIQRIRDESHRFAHQYHVLKRKKAFLPKI